MMHKESMDKKPGLMIAVMEGLKKKGKMERSSDSEEYSDEEGYREHLEQISKEFIQAVHQEDYQAVADLFEEAFECMESAPHEEGPHLGEESETKSSRY